MMGKLLSKCVCFDHFITILFKLAKIITLHMPLVLNFYLNFKLLQFDGIMKIPK